MGRRPYTSLDRMDSRQKLLLACLSVAATTQIHVLMDLLDDKAADGAEDAFYTASRNTQLMMELAIVASAAEPFFRPKITYKIGPEKYSFARLERQFGDSTTCKATFRFNLPDLRRLYTGLKFPEVIQTPNGYSATGEEVFLYMLKRLSYPATLSTLAWDSGRSISAQSEIFQVVCATRACATCSSARASARIHVRQLRQSACTCAREACATHVRPLALPLMRGLMRSRSIRTHEHRLGWTTCTRSLRTCETIARSSVGRGTFSGLRMQFIVVGARVRCP